ncbi:MAG TPA: lamin tail domain-containing protein [Planctomycetota bacterium]|nr:lamin tail domain-containing protein [Planctomycetota bacterium]
MHRASRAVLALASLALAAAALASAASSQTLRIYAIDVGQGSSTLLVGPTGTTLLVDGGPDQSGWDSNPNGPGPIAQLLAAQGIAQLDYTLLTHYHSDHYEGLTELAQHNYLKPGAKSYDRGNVPAPENGFTTAINQYLAAVGAHRTTIALGEVIDLGGGATARCMVKAGAIFGGPTIDTSGSAQLENSNSIGLKVTFGNFQAWIGGDLTGGGGSTTDVESQAAAFVGNVDLHVADHHGSSTSSNATFLNVLAPELSIASCGLHNTFNHPSGTYLNNANKAARSVLTYSTTGGADNDGFGNRGFVNSEGTIRVETDGSTYTVTPTVGPAFKIACDELSSQFAGPAPGDLRISEFNPDPNIAPDSAGEWFEVVNVSGLERNLAGLQISSTDGTNLFTFATPVLLRPGARFVIGNDGDRQRNGGATIAHCEPFSVFSLANGPDGIRLRNASAQIVDELTYTTGTWPFAVGFSAQKNDLLASNATSAAWSMSTAVYGLGDRGTPGAKGSAETTAFPALFVSASTPAIGTTWTVNFCSLGESAPIYVAAIAESTAPPLFALFGQSLPLQFDALLGNSLGFPGFVAFLDANGFAQTQLPIPNDPALHGFAFFGAVMTFGFPSLLPGQVSAAVPLAIP